MSNNLIELDTSLDLEDFDPLNQNAKPIPRQPQRLVTPTLGLNEKQMSASMNRPIAFSNPVYPFHLPQQLSSQAVRSEDDVELLRKYGLDQFHLSGARPKIVDPHMNKSHRVDAFCSPVNGNGTSRLNVYLNNAAASGPSQSTTNSWTTFD